jgi:hypothetical protein
VPVRVWNRDIPGNKATVNGPGQTRAASAAALRSGGAFYTINRFAAAISRKFQGVNFSVFATAWLVSS